MASITEKELSQKIFSAAFALLEWAEGSSSDTPSELARGLWKDAFEEVNRIRIICVVLTGDTALRDDFERRVSEQAERFVSKQVTRFEQAAEARRKFHVVKGDNDDKDD